MPKSVSSKFPAKGEAMVEGIMNSFPFRAKVQGDGKGGHKLNVSKALQKASGARAGESVSVEITRVDDEPEARVPADFRKALAADPIVRAMWSDITPLARRDWVLWVTSAKQGETRKRRVEVACSKLASGMRRVCCFPGLNWMTKGHPRSETWAPLPKAKK